MSSRRPDQRVVVTGLGVVSPLGNGTAAFERGLRGGRCGLSPIDLPWPTGYATTLAGVCDLDGPPRFAAGTIPPDDETPRVVRLAAEAARQALEQAGSDSSSDGVIILGTTWGAALEVEHDLQRSPPAGRREAFDSLGERIGALAGLDGPHAVVTTTCAAGNHALALGRDLIRSGRAERVVAVGADALAFVTLLGFCRLLLQDPDGCHPFDLNRNGTVLAEGAGALILERADVAAGRGATPLAEIAGCGLSCDAAGPFESNPTEVGPLEKAAYAALGEAGLTPQRIDAVSAHGSATKLNDAKETYFLRRLLADRADAVPVTGLKSMLGHAQGAAAALEAVACVLSLQNQVVYPTINRTTPDPACDLDYVTEPTARAQPVSTILSNAFGMGGTNAIVILRGVDA